MSQIALVVKVKTLYSANKMTMELYKFAPNTTYPDHFYEGPELFYILEVSTYQNGKLLKNVVLVQQKQEH